MILLQKVDELENRVLSILEHIVEQFEDMKESNDAFARNEIQSIETVEKILLLVDKRLMARKMESVMDSQSIDSLQAILGIEDDVD